MCNSVTAYFAPPAHLSGEDLRSYQSKIDQAAKASFAELAYTLTMTTITAFFVAPGSIPILYLGTIVIWGVSTYFRQNAIEVEYSDIGTRRANEKFATFLKMASLCLFSSNDLFTRDMVTHEFGHAACDYVFYKAGKISIRIFPFLSGVTTLRGGILNSFGKYLGLKNVRIITKVAGTGLTMLFNLGWIAFAHFKKNSSLEMSQRMNAMAIISIAGSALYAFSAIFEDVKELSDDFVYLYVLGGIHPIVSMIVIIAIPILFKKSLNYFY